MSEIEYLITETEDLRKRALHSPGGPSAYRLAKELIPELLLEINNCRDLIARLSVERDAALEMARNYRSSLQELDD